jgi:predicted dehydrogenase
VVNFGIAGFGLHAVKRLMPGFAAASNCRVTAISRRDPAKARKSADQYQIPLAFTSTEELCRSPEVDAIFVATPNAFHLRDVLTAIAHDKPVLCEKPMGINAAECAQMVTSARASQVLLGVAQVFRFEESTAWLREHVATGTLGRPVFVRAEFGFLAGPQHPRTWIRDRSVAGGGPIADIGVHCIDVLRFILQDEIIRVSAIGDFNRDRGDVEESAGLLLEFARGTLGTVMVSFRAEYRTPIELVGELGVLRSENALTVDRPVRLELCQEGGVVESVTVDNSLAYARQVEAFAAAVESKADFPAPGEEGWRNQLILDAAYRSIGSGETEDVPSILPKN